MDYGHEPRMRGGGGGGGEGWHLVVWPKRIRATEQGFVFRSWVLDRVYNFTI